MTSTLWFWITLLIVLLFLIWIIRRFIGRVIIICVVLFLLFLLWRWVHPSSANVTWRWISNIPVNATNFVNHDLLNKDIVLPLYNPIQSVKDTLSDAVDIDVDLDLDSIDIDAVDFDSEDLDIDIDIENELTGDLNEDEPRYSWFSKLFNSDKDDVKESDDKEVDVLIDSETTTGKKFVENRQQESVELKFSENGEIIVETTTTGGEKIIDTVVKVGSEKGSTKDDVADVKTGSTSLVKEDKTTKVDKPAVTTGSKVNTGKEENEIVYLPSNPKKVETTTKATSTSKTSTTSQITSYKPVKGLTADEVREANEIFN